MVPKFIGKNLSSLLALSHIIAAKEQGFLIKKAFEISI